MYIPHCFNSFQGFSVKDIKEFRSELRMEIILQPTEDRKPICNVCGHQLGAKHDTYWTTAQHLRAFGWKTAVSFPRGKHYCANCNKVCYKS